MGAVMRFVGSMLFAAFGLVQLFIGFGGIEVMWGQGWAWAALVAAVLFRFTIPILVGIYLYTTEAWGWPWYGAVLFAMPVLALMVPGIVAGVLGALRPSRHEAAAMPTPIQRGLHSEAIFAADILDEPSPAAADLIATLDDVAKDGTCSVEPGRNRATEKP